MFFTLMLRQAKCLDVCFLRFYTCQYKDYVLFLEYTAHADGYRGSNPSPETASDPFHAWELTEFKTYQAQSQASNGAVGCIQSNLKFLA